MARLVGVDTRVARLGVTAADVATRGAQADVEAVTALLAAIRLGGRDRCGEVLTWLG